MRILETIATADPAYGGPLEGLLRHAEVWRAAGHDCEMATLDPPDAPFLKTTPLPVHALGVHRPWLSERVRRLAPPFRYGYAPGVVPWLAANARRYDAVIVNGLWNYSTLAARIALGGGTVPYFVFSHGMMDPWFRSADRLKHAAKQASWLVAEGPLVNGAAAVLFTTEEERRAARGVFRPYRVREAVVGYGTADAGGDAEAQIRAFRATVPGLGARPYLLYLGRIHPKKGADLLIDAYAAAAAAGGPAADLDLVIAGPDAVGWRRRLEDLAARHGIARRLHWPGMLSGDAKWGAFRGAEAFVLPSHQENFGVVVAEALATARPVLISDKVNIWREVEAAGAGLVAPDTAEGTRRLLDGFAALSPDDRRRMGAAGRRLFEERYTVERAAARLLAVISGGGDDGHP